MATQLDYTFDAAIESTQNVSAQPLFYLDTNNCFDDCFDEDPFEE